MAEVCTLGIDVGTSGVRAALVDSDGHLLRSAKSFMAAHGANHRDPMVWQAALHTALTQLSINEIVGAVCVDATSGTVLPIDAAGHPLADALMYNDAVDQDSVIDQIKYHAPAKSAVHGVSSALARAMVLQTTPGAVRVIHQADWIAGQFSGRFDITDESNALKTGYDPVQRCWPQWLEDTTMKVAMLPEVVPAGTATGSVLSPMASRYQLARNTRVIAGVTDGCASFLATGASDIGDCVTALGSTITMKMLCDQPLFDPAYGVYSHRIGDKWLAGGASNTGGAVLAHYFSADEISLLSGQLNPDRSAVFNYYPLLSAGERFPHNDGNWQPRLMPRPDSDVEFLHELFSGMAAIESLGYQRLAELGAPPQLSMRTVGGGALNSQWTEIRRRQLKLPFHQPLSTEAAVGSALLARNAMANQR